MPDVHEDGEQVKWKAAKQRARERYLPKQQLTVGRYLPHPHQLPGVLRVHPEEVLRGAALVHEGNLLRATVGLARAEAEGQHHQDQAQPQCAGEDKPPAASPLPFWPMHLQS